MKVTISQSNTKLGMIPTISLPPIITCRKNAPCAKDCYGKLVNGVDVCKFGKQWVVSMAAMIREYGNPKM